MHMMAWVCKYNWTAADSKQNWTLNVRFVFTAFGVILTLNCCSNHIDSTSQLAQQFFLVFSIKKCNLLRN